MEEEVRRHRQGFDLIARQRLAGALQAKATEDPSILMGGAGTPAAAAEETAADEAPEAEAAASDDAPASEETTEATESTQA